MEYGPANFNNNKSFDKLSEQTNNGRTTVKYRKGSQNIAVTFNKPSETPLKIFADTFNDIVSDIANKRASA